jgi:OHCU decarboxylase
VAVGLEALQDLLATMGVEIEAPFMTLSFLALSVIPSLKITDRGLVDVDAFALVPLAVNGHIELSREAFVARFGSLYEHSPWVAEHAWRPSFAGLDELADALGEAMRAAPPDAQLALIRAHPDLGEKVGVLTEHSRAEQAGLGLDRLTPDLHARFVAVNTAYREKFGIPFVVCVREHGSPESILADADRRLGNTTEQEIATALGEIAKIARLRLEDLA